MGDIIVVGFFLFVSFLIHKYECMNARFCQCVSETQKVNELNYNEAGFLLVECRTRLRSVYVLLFRCSS